VKVESRLGLTSDEVNGEAAIPLSERGRVGDDGIDLRKRDREGVGFASFGNRFDEDVLYRTKNHVIRPLQTAPSVCLLSPEERGEEGRSSPESSVSALDPSALTKLS
jgi:hypothetical protein